MYFGEISATLLYRTCAYVRSEKIIARTRKTYIRMCLPIQKRKSQCETMQKYTVMSFHFERDVSRTL